MTTTTTTTTLRTYCGRIARITASDTVTEQVRNELAPAFALVAQSGIRTAELMVQLASLGDEGKAVALESFVALHKRDKEAGAKAVTAFAMARNKMVNPKQRAFDSNVAKVWNDASIRIGKAGVPELYTPKTRKGNGRNQNGKPARTEAHARAIVRAWRFRGELRAARAALQAAERKPAARKPAARKPAARKPAAA